ncbi:MAG: methyltransferase domain-containing protein [Clostridia bacterium]|nr:methyltransferase domain-containing protein [Clostridia bacterium]
MTDREWDKHLHIHTIGREDEANPHYSPYEPTPYSVLERLADSGHIERKDHLLDYGCGKGRVAFFMASMVGCRVTGIDHSQKLIDIAKENRRASRLGDRVSLYCTLAEQYEVGNENTFFFFNPFSEKVFEGVLRRLVQRGTGTLICYYPSEAYITWLNLTPEAEHVDTIDCRDLFNGKDERERIEVFHLREIETIG